MQENDAHVMHTKCSSAPGSDLDRARKKIIVSNVLEEYLEIGRAKDESTNLTDSRKGKHRCRSDG